MSGVFDRRRILKGAAAGLVGAAMPGWSQAFAQAGGTKLRAYWWGSQERTDRTNKSFALYQQKNQNVAVAGESLAWGDYWTRLATQTAGRNAPDLIQMDYRFIAEYARRGALLPLDEYLGKGLDIGGYDKASLDSCRVGGKLYGVNLGNNTHAMIHNKAAFKKAGLPDPQNVKWDDFIRMCAEVTKAHNGELYGTSDGGGEESIFENWLRQRGKALFTDGGSLALDEGDAGDWFGMWAKMRETKACPPADIQALDKKNLETSLVTLGKAACAWNHSNQVVAAQGLNKNPLGVAMYPQGAGPNPGHYLKPSQMWSVYSRTKMPEDVVKLASFTVADPEGARLLGVERGVPAIPKIRELVSGDLDDLGKMVVAYVADVSPKVGPIPPAPPQGAGEVMILLNRINEQVGFGRTPVGEAAKQYVSEAKAILAR